MYIQEPKHDRLNGNLVCRLRDLPGKINRARIAFDELANHPWNVCFVSCDHYYVPMRLLQPSGNLFRGTFAIYAHLGWRDRRWV